MIESLKPIQNMGKILQPLQLGAVARRTSSAGRSVHGVLKDPPSAGQRSRCPRSRGERGQALVEMAVILPIGLLLLLAVGYIGRALIERQAMFGAARFAAREAALDAMRSPGAKASGAGVAAQSAAGGNRAKNAQEASGRAVDSVAPLWEPVTGIVRSQLQPVPLGPYGMAFMARKSASVGGTSVHFGIGFVLYGAKVKERLTFLEPARKAVSGASKMNANPTRGLAAPLEVSGSAYMPGELPVHGPVGLVMANDWIKKILEE